MRPMTRYVLKESEAPDHLSVFDNEANEVLGVLPIAEAGVKARQLNYSERGRKSRTNRWDREPRPGDFIERIVKLRDANLSFLAIADLLGVTVQVVHRIYHLEDKKRTAEAWLAANPINDETPMDRLAHRLSDKVCQSLVALNVGLGKPGTVGIIRRAPDDLLLSLEGIGAQHLKTIREVFGFDPGTQDLKIAAFTKLLVQEGLEQAKRCS